MKGDSILTEVLVKFLLSVSSPFRSLLIVGGIIVTGTSLMAAPSTISASAPMQDDSTAISAAPAISGNWQMSWTTAKGKEKQGTVQIKQNGNKLSGTLQGERGSTPLKGSLQGNQVSFRVKMKKGETSFTGTVDADKMSGTTEDGTSWTATRQQ